MKYLIEYRNKWGDMIRQASTADDAAGAFAEADVACTPDSKNVLVGVYAAIERSSETVAQGPNGPIGPIGESYSDERLDAALEATHGDAPAPDHDA